MYIKNNLIHVVACAVSLQQLSLQNCYQTALVSSLSAIMDAAEQAEKPDPLPLTHACDYFSNTSAQGLLVGDSANDVKAAHAAGMPVMCVNYGYNQGVDLATLDTLGVIDSLQALQDHVTLLQ